MLILSRFFYSQKLSARVQTPKASQLPILSRLHQTALTLQKTLGADDLARRYKARKNREKTKDNSLEKCLVRMFLQGRVPLIKPYVPDALHYREASAAKMTSLLSTPYAKLRRLK